MSFACTCICDERGFGITFLDTETNTSLHCQPCQTQTESVSWAHDNLGPYEGHGQAGMEILQGNLD